ncbi:MAG TPA: glycosyl hydrolase family 8, partial [Bacteroidales bacterium]|nr:glycosyl hydrolase family 8 [Bacteroidales bacterium]
KAASARTITVMFQQLAADYAVYKTFTYNLTTTAQTFTETFTLTGTVASASKIAFCVGNNAACVSIDKVSFGYGTTSGGGTVDPPVSNGQGAFFTDVYTNLFKEVLGKTDTEINTKVTNAFQQIFYGTSTQKLYYEVGTDMAYILDVNNNDVRTEGMSYGMMICVQLNKQAEFNKLWKWAKTYMQYGTSSNYSGYFAWQCNTDGSIKGNGPASDGEAYFITALFFAANRWGNGTGIYNYAAEAQDILVRVMNKTGAGSVYNLFNSTSKLITFVPYGDSYNFTDPSYNLPAFWELWARWSTSNTTFWAQTPEASRKLLRDASHPTSGLTTDYSNFDGTPKEVSYNTDADRFMYDAWRTAMNIGMDYHWFRTDSTNQRAIVTRYLTFFKNQGTNYKNHYDWNGANPGGDHSTGLVACNAAACFAVSDNTLRTPFLTEFWNIAIPTGTYRYYDGMLYMLALLHCSGNFKIWKPTCTPPSAPTVTTPVTYCQGATATALTATGTSLNWYTVATGGTASTTAPTPSTATAGNTTYYVSQTVSGCESTRASIVVTITALPSAPTVTTPVIYNQGAVSTALTATGTSLKWYTVATGGTASTTAPTPSTTTVGNTTYYVSQTVSGCESPRALI